MSSQASNSRAPKERHEKKIPGRTHRLCASLIILRKSKEDKTEVLIVHKQRRRDAWQVPQGGIEPGESLHAGAKRELFEETNICVSTKLLKTPFVFQYNYPKEFIKREKPLYRGQRLVILASEIPIGEHITVDNIELDRYKWIPVRQLGRYIRRRNYRDTIRKAIRWSEEQLFKESH